MIDEYFQTLTTFPPRNFQREAIAKLLHRQDILLRASNSHFEKNKVLAPILEFKI